MTRPDTTRVTSEDVLSSPFKKRTLEVYIKLAQITSGTMCVRYGRNDLRRMFKGEADGHGVTVRDLGPSDPLASMLLNGLSSLPKNDPKGKASENILIMDSVNVCLESDLSDKKPRLWIAFDMEQGRSRVVGGMTVFEYAKTDLLTTDHWTQEWLSKYSLPRFDASWLLIDVISSEKKGSATILVLHVILACIRENKKGIIAYAMTKRGSSLFEKLGFSRGKNAGKQVYFVKTEDIDLTKFHDRLRLDKSFVTDTCWRRGLTEKTSHSVVSRC